MHKLAIGLAILFAVTLPLAAQDYKAEIFGGYQYTRVNPGSGADGENLNGWNASVTGNVGKHFGITGDMSGGYKSIGGVSVKVHNFMFGPTISNNSAEKVKPFAHALFGVSHASAGISGIGASDNAFAMALGGGVDLGVHKNVAVRLFQFDYLMTRFISATQNNVRLSTGVVVRF